MKYNVDLLREKFNEGLPDLDSLTVDLCWEWQGNYGNHGYGRIRLYSKFQYQKFVNEITAHRLSFTLLRGNIPHNRCVLHRCNNKRCINPSHLYLGTKKDNMVDNYTQGNLTGGEKHHGSKLSDIQVREIIRLKGTMSQRKIAKLYGISYTIVQRLHSGTSTRLKYLCA